MIIESDGIVFAITCPKMDMRAKEAPSSSYCKKTETWVLEINDMNISYLKRNYNRKDFSPGALSMLVKAVVKDLSTFPRDHKFVFQPMEKQWEALDLAWSVDNAALLLEMGCGKTFVTINIAVARAIRKKITKLLVLCPTSVKPVWEMEFEKHCPIDYRLHVVESKNKKQTDRFIETRNSSFTVLVVGIEALSQGSAFNSALEFLGGSDVMIALDESSRIKNPKAGRTTKAAKLGRHSKYNMILTGTSITQGIHDLYSQFRFLDWKIIGQKSYYTFQNRYCVMGGFEGRKIVGYRNIDELVDLISCNSIVIKKSEMMDLPPKVYETRHVNPSPEQAKALRELGDPFVMATEVEGRILEVETVLERMTRYQQIVGGHFPWKEGRDSGILMMPGKNPKLEALLAIIDELPLDAKVIIWTRFRPESDLIAMKLFDKEGSTLQYNGDTARDKRREVLEQFQTDPKCRFFISSPAMGGIGITLTAATYVIYYSNTFSLEDRMQSEDRNHRKGQDNKVTYIDIVMSKGVDGAMVCALKNKKEIADYVSEKMRGEYL